MVSERQLSPLHPDIIEFAYRRGFFPMPHPDTGEILWFDPDPRAVIPLEGFHASRSLKKSMRKRGYRVTWNTAFTEVVASCASRPETWITPEFQKMYFQMYQRGFAGSVEVWSEDVLVGGVFGLMFGGVFNGESMFSTKTDASKIALYALVHAMKRADMRILEVQFMTPHLSRLGAMGVSKEEYHAALSVAVGLPKTLATQHFEGWNG